MIGDWNNSGVIFAALPSILSSGTGPEPFSTGPFPMYYTDVVVSGNFIDMSDGYGYSGGYIFSDGSGYLHTDYPFTLSPTSISTIETTMSLDYNQGAPGGNPYNICGSFEDANNYWLATVTESGALKFEWNVGGSGGYVDTDSGVFPDGTLSTVYFEKNISGVSIFVGSGECDYINESVYDQGTGVFSDVDVLNYNEMTTAFPDPVCKFVLYDKVLTDDEKNWNDNNCTYSGLYGYDSGVFLDVTDTYRTISTSSFVGFVRKPTLMQRALRGNLRGTLSFN